jgi:hypothetical protein
MNASANLPVSLTFDASAATTAWLNAFLATGQSEERQVLYRTMSVEFYPNGVQLIACDGTVLFRTWVPAGNAMLGAWPDASVAPDATAVVMDADKFASTFMTTLRTAVSEFPTEITIAIDQEESEQVSLSDDLVPNVLTLGALGQHLHCRLLDQPYPSWRQFRFGLDPAELVDGLRLARRLFATVGKLRGVDGVDLSFHGESNRIEFTTTGTAEVRGLLMPMRRTKDEASEDQDDK